MLEPTNRCGACAFCCDAPIISELGKPANVLCEHYREKAGCSIWQKRPVACRRFICLWHANPSFPESLRPDRCGVMFEPLKGRPVIMANVDPQRPDSHKKGIVKELIDRYLESGTSVAIVVGQKNEYQLAEGVGFVPFWRHIKEAAKELGAE